MDGFPVVAAGRKIDRDPVVTSGVGFVERAVERGGISGGRERHLVDGDVGATGSMVILQVDPATVFRKFSVTGQE